MPLDELCPTDWNRFMKMDFYDFFSGCGGTSRGMQQAGLNVHFGLDVDEDAQSTFIENFPKAKFLRKDIREVDVSDLDGIVSWGKGQVKVFAACAPCQPFSKQNRTLGGTDGRRTLLAEFHRFVEGFRPEYVFLENVPGLQNVNKRKGPFGDFVMLLKRLGYEVDYKIVLAYNYDVPQRRRRLVMIASNLGKVTIPAPTCGRSDELKEIPSVWSHIKHLPPIQAGESHPKIKNHRAARLSELNLQRISSTPEGGDRSSWPEELLLSCHAEHSGHTDVYGRMVKDQPAPALTTRCISLSNGRFGHPTQDRAISVREAACLQTFPMDFVFHGNLNSMARQIGNAVPVAMAEIFGKAIQSHYLNHRMRNGS